MAGTTLQHRNCILKLVDPCIRKQEKVTLRSASFLRDQLFDGQAKPVVARLKDSDQDFSLQKSIKAMVAATQQRPPFQGAGTSQVPKNIKPISKGAKSSRSSGSSLLTKQHPSTQPKQGATATARNQGAKPPARESWSTKQNLFKHGPHK